MPLNTFFYLLTLYKVPILYMIFQIHEQIFQIVIWSEIRYNSKFHRDHK